MFVFFSSKMKERDEQLIPRFIGEAFSKYSNQPTKDVLALFKQGRLKIYLKSFLKQTLTGESLFYGLIIDKEKDLSRIGLEVDNSVLVESYPLYVVRGDQYPFICKRVIECSNGKFCVETSRRSLSASDSRFDLDVFSFCLSGILEACDQEMKDKKITLRQALREVLKNPDSKETETPWFIDSWDMDVLPEKIEQYIQSGQSFLEEFVTKRLESPGRFNPEAFLRLLEENKEEGSERLLPTFKV